MRHGDYHLRKKELSDIFARLAPEHKDKHDKQSWVSSLTKWKASCQRNTQGVALAPGEKIARAAALCAGLSVIPDLALVRASIRLLLLANLLSDFLLARSRFRGPQDSASDDNEEPDTELDVISDGDSDADDESKQQISRRRAVPSQNSGLARPFPAPLPLLNTGSSAAVPVHAPNLSPNTMTDSDMQPSPSPSTVAAAALRTQHADHKHSTGVGRTPRPPMLTTSRQTAEEEEWVRKRREDDERSAARERENIARARAIGDAEAAMLVLIRQREQQPGYRPELRVGFTVQYHTSNPVQMYDPNRKFVNTRIVHISDDNKVWFQDGGHLAINYQANLAQNNVMTLGDGRLRVVSPAESQTSFLAPEVL